MKRRLYVFTLSLFFLLNVKAFSNEGFESRIGTKIDSVEQYYFELFPRIRDFVEAQFYKVNEDSSYFKVTHRLKGNLKDSIFTLTPAMVKCFSFYILNYEDFWIDEKFLTRDTNDIKTLSSMNTTILSIDTKVIPFLTDGHRDLQSNHPMYFQLVNGEEASGYLFYMDSSGVILSSKYDHFRWADRDKLTYINYTQIKSFSGFLRHKYIYSNPILWKKVVSQYASTAFFEDPNSQDTPEELRRLIKELPKVKETRSLSQIRNEYDSIVSSQTKYFTFRLHTNSKLIGTKAPDKPFTAIPISYIYGEVPKLVYYSSNMVANEPDLSISFDFRIDRYNEIGIGYQTCKPLQDVNQFYKQEYSTRYTKIKNSYADLTYTRHLFPENILFSSLLDRFDLSVYASLNVCFNEIEYCLGQWAAEDGHYEYFNTSKQKAIGYKLGGRVSFYLFENLSLCFDYGYYSGADFPTNSDKISIYSKNPTAKNNACTFYAPKVTNPSVSFTKFGVELHI